MEKEIKIQVPGGYEIDKEKSTFEKIVFKNKEKVVNTWEDLEKIEGYYIKAQAVIGDKNVFLNKKYAESALALAQISQLLPYYDSNVDWSKDSTKYCLYRCNKTIGITGTTYKYYLLAFNTRQEAERFIMYNEQLVKDYYMLD